MRKTTQLAGLLFLLALTAPSLSAQSAAAPAAPTEIDPVGMYDFEATRGITTKTGTIEIARTAEGGFGGEVWLEGEGAPAVIQSGTVTGERVELASLVNGSLPVAFVFDLDGDAIQGFAVANGDTITFEGTRRTRETD